MFNFAGHSATRRPLVHSRFRTIATLTASCLICLPGALSAIGDDTVTEALQVYGLGYVNSVAFSPDGSEVLVGAAANAMLYDRATGQLLRSFTGHTAQVNSVAFSSDGSVIAAGSSDMTTRLWSVSNGQLLHVLTGHTDSVNSVAFSPVANTIATASSDHTWKLWSVATGNLIRTFIGHTNIVTGVAFSPDGTSAVSGSRDASARLWDVSSGGLIQAYPHNCLSVAFSPDGSEVLTGGTDGFAKLWDAFEGTFVRGFSAQNAASVAFSPDGTKVVLVYCYNIPCGAIVYERDTGTFVSSMFGHTSSTTSVAISFDGLYVVTGGNDYTARIWSAQSGAALRTIGGHQSILTSVAISPDGTKLLTGSGDNTARIWNLATGNQIRTLTSHTNSVNSVKFSPDGGRALTGSYDNTAKLWNTSNGALVRTFAGHTASVNSVAFNADGTRILTGSSDQTARLRNANTGALIQVFSGYYFYSVGILPGGSHIYTGNGGNRTRVWDVATGAVLLELGPGDQSAAASNDGTRVLAAYAYWVFVWDASTGTLVNQIYAHPSPYSVTSAAFSPDGTRLLTGGNDNVVKLWDAHDATLLRTFKGHTSNISSVAFSPDGAKVLTASYDGTAKLWDAGDAPAPPGDQPGAGGDVPSTIVTLEHLWEWSDAEGRFIQPPNNQVTLDPTKPTYLLTHGWDGDLAAYSQSSIACAIRHADPEANVIAWDWADLANPDGNPNTASLIDGPAIEILMNKPWGPILAAAVWLDAFRSGLRAEAQGNVLGKALADVLKNHESLGTKLHLIGHSHGGGLLGQAAREMKRLGSPADSLTTLDTPKVGCIGGVCLINSLKYVDPSSVQRAATFYYQLSCTGVGAAAPTGATNVELNCNHVQDIAHLWITGADDGVCPSDQGWYPPGVWNAATGQPAFVKFNGQQRSLLDPLAFPSGSFKEGLVREFASAPMPQPLPDVDLTDALALLASDPFDSASTWSATGAMLVSGADPDDSANRVIVLNEDGDASFFKDIEWPAASVVMNFDYMFRVPRGGESLTVYLNGEPVYYDCAETTLATNKLTSSGAIYIGGAAGSTARLNFVLRTDDTYGGQLLLDNIRIFGLPCDPCDTNCNGTVNQFDIQPFVELLIPPAPPPCGPCAGDTNSNGTVNQFDINGFLDCLIP